MIARAALVASLLAIAIAALASRAEAAPGLAAGDPSTKVAAVAEDASTERPTCRIVKVVYAGHGEAERAPCRPAR